MSTSTSTSTAMATNNAASPSPTAAAPISAGCRYVTVVLLNREELTLVTEAKAKGQQLLSQVCSVLEVKEPQYFGLTTLQDGEHEFIDLKNKLSKYFPKGWKSNSGSPSANGSHRPAKPAAATTTVCCRFYFRVQFYVEHLALLEDDVSRHQYYLQLKQNVTELNVTSPEETYFVLAAYALQADLGNYLLTFHKERYFDPRKYFPQWVVRRRGEEYIVKSMPEIHIDQRGMTQQEAQKMYIMEVSAQPEYTMHFGQLKRTKTEAVPSLKLGISTRGIYILQNREGLLVPMYDYSWTSIKRLRFDKKCFELLAEGLPNSYKLCFYTSGDAKSKYFLRLCKETHLFQIQTQPKVDKLLKLDKAKERKKYRESYISGDSDWEFDALGSLGRLGAGVSDRHIQRRSMVSTASSNTTSGIVSDDKSPLEKSLSSSSFPITGSTQELDEPGETEYMITGPPTDHLPPPPLPKTAPPPPSLLTPTPSPSPTTTAVSVEVHCAAAGEAANHSGQALTSDPSSVDENSLSSDDDEQLPEESTEQSTEAVAAAAVRPKTGRARHKRSLQDELKELQLQESNCPLISALCNDKSLKLMALGGDGEGEQGGAAHSLASSPSPNLDSAASDSATTLLVASSTVSLESSDPARASGSAPEKWVKSQTLPVKMAPLASYPEGALSVEESYREEVSHHQSSQSNSEPNLPTQLVSPGCA